MTGRDTTHLQALITSLSNERGRLAKAKTEKEREMRRVWIAQTEREIAAEEKFLGMEPVAPFEGSLDDLAVALT